MTRAAALHTSLVRELCIRSFKAFIDRSWPYVEPTRALLPSIAFDGIAAALQAVAEGRIKRLGIACPPGVSKSKVAAVQFPAWLLLRTDGTSRVMTGSYGHDLAERDSRATRDLVNAPWFRDLVAGRWKVREDVGNKVDDWTTTRTGRRIAVSTGSATTGERATMQILDDLLNAKHALSEEKRKEAVYWLSQVLPSRLEDAQNDPRVLIGQRLHVADPMSVAIAQGWKVLVLPAVLGPCPELGITTEDAPCVLLDDEGREVWRDPRKPGQPLVSLLGIEALQRLKVELGSVAFNAQYLQRPSDDSTSIIRRTWWRFHRPSHVSASAPRPGGCDQDQPAVDTPERFERVTIAADLTFGSMTGDFCSVQAWARLKGGRYLLDAFHKRCGFEEQIVAIKAMAAKFPGCKVVVEKAANGAAVIEQLRKAMPGVIAVKPIGSKAARLSAVAPAVESGACYLPLGAPWLEAYVEELAGAAKHDDQQDAAAYALHDLASTSKPSPCAGRGFYVNDGGEWESYESDRGFGGHSAWPAPLTSDFDD